MRNLQQGWQNVSASRTTFNKSYACFMFSKTVKALDRKSKLKPSKCMEWEHSWQLDDIPANREFPTPVTQTRFHDDV